MAGTCLILGATSDMAQAVARRLAGAGWNLQLTARDPDQLRDECADLRLRARERISVRAHQLDIRDFDSHESFYNALESRPDLVICFIGLLGDQKQAEADPGLRRAVIETNYTGPVNLLSIIANDFAQRGTGTIIGVSSVAGDRGRAANYIYGSAKAGFTAFLAGLRNRLHGTGAHVITVLPGFVATSMTQGMDLPDKLTAKPENVAKAIDKAHRRGRNIIYVRPIWWAIMFVIRHIPESIFKRMNI